MGQEKTARQDVIPRRASADEHGKGAEPVGATSRGLELSLGAAASGVKAPWVTASLRGAGLTPTQIASIHQPAHHEHSHHHAHAAHHAHSAHPASRIAHAELAHAESHHVPEAHAAPSHGPIAPSSVAPASAPEVAPLHEAGAAVAQHADAGVAPPPIRAACRDMLQGDRVT